MAYPVRQLGIAPALVAAAIPTVENFFASMGSGALTNRALPQVAVAVNGFFTTVLNDLSNIANPGTTAGLTFARLRCLGGDLSEDAAFGATAPPYCGYAEQSSREYARAAVVIAASHAIANGVSVPTSYTFRDVNAAGGGNRTLTASAALANAPLPPPDGAGAGSGAPGGTIYTTFPGGGGINLPVPASSILNATIGGIPVMAILLAFGVFAFAGGRGTRR